MLSLRKFLGGYHQACWEELGWGWGTELKIPLSLHRPWIGLGGLQHHIISVYQSWRALLPITRAVLSPLLYWREAFYQVTPRLETLPLLPNLSSLCLHGTTEKRMGEPTSAILPHPTDRKFIEGWRSLCPPQATLVPTVSGEPQLGSVARPRSGSATSASVPLAAQLLSSPAPSRGPEL